LLKYEDLAAGNLDIDDMADYLGTPLRAEVLERKVTGRGKKRLEPIPALERRLLRKSVEPLAGRLGYSSSDDGR
jgi:hypothetical protein